MALSHKVQSYVTNFKNRIAPTLELRDLAWTIHIWGGTTPFNLTPMPNARNPVLSASEVTDLVATFVADPFLVVDDGLWYMFFEALEARSNRGVICCAFSRDACDWTYKGVVLREGFHLSYPYTFRNNGIFYMIPESAEAGSVRLYQAKTFPTNWSLKAELFSGCHWDPSILKFDDIWWLFSYNKLHGANELRLHFSTDLLGSWKEHPMSPIVRDNPHFTRPGGRFIHYDNRLFRIAQDTYPEYGLQLFAFEILELTATTYTERPIREGPILKGKGKAWFRDRIHHLDAHQTTNGNWIAAIDFLHPRIRPRLKSEV